tara:strand:+ start:1529 stop:1786 length:258 start_codon:yes stop_codon:yes gene_type:complete
MEHRIGYTEAGKIANASKYVLKDFGTSGSYDKDRHRHFMVLIDLYANKYECCPKHLYLVIRGTKEHVYDKQGWLDFNADEPRQRF